MMKGLRLVITSIAIFIQVQQSISFPLLSIQWSFSRPVSIPVSLQYASGLHMNKKGSRMTTPSKEKGEGTIHHTTTTTSSSPSQLPPTPLSLSSSSSSSSIISKKNNNPTTSTSIIIHQRRHRHTEPEELTPLEHISPEYEKSCTKELQWLLRTTSSIIGNNNQNHSNTSASSTNQGRDQDSKDEHRNEKHHHVIQNNAVEETTAASTSDSDSASPPPIGKLPRNTIRKFPLIMRAWAKRCSIPHLQSNAAHVVERLFERLLEERNCGNIAVEKEGVISTNIYNIMLEAWANTSGKKHSYSTNNSPSPGTTSSSMMGASTNTNSSRSTTTTTSSSGTKNDTKKENFRIMAAKKAQCILNRMEEVANADKSMAPDAKSYYLVLKAWVRSRDYSAVDEMEKILCRMEDLGLYTSTFTSSSSSTSTSTYNSENDDNNASQHSPSNHDHGANVEPTTASASASTSSANADANARSITKCYNLYLYALANRRSKYNPKVDAKKAYSILLGLKEKSMMDGVVTFDTNTYNQVLSTFAKMQNFEGANKAQIIFDDMLNEANATNVHPDTNTFNTLMNCWLKSGPRGRQHVEKLLNTMVEMSTHHGGHEEASPDRFSVNTAIAAVSKSGRKDSVRKAYYMLMNMEDLFHVSPDTTSYNLLLSAYARSRDLQAGKKAQKLLKEMEDLFKKGNHDVVPDSFTYSTVIDALPNPSKAEKVMGSMRYIFEKYGGKEPDVVVYNALLNAYSTCGIENSVYQARDILYYMEESYNAGNEKLKPNIISYNTVLKAYSHAMGDFTTEANDLLCEMERRYSSGESDVAPDVISYTTVISSYSRSEVTQKARVAQGVLQRMIDAYNLGNKAARPTVYSFNSCLNACAFTFCQEEKVDAFLVAVSTLVMLQEWTKPDHTTYGTLLKAWCNLIPKDDERRHRIVNSVFKQCCKDGQVGSMVLRQLRYAASPALYKTLIGRSINEDVELSELPSRWSRNVKERNGKIARIPR